MPKSQKPRKKGKRGRVFDDVHRAERHAYKTPEEARRLHARLWRANESIKAKRKRASWLTVLVDDSELQEAFIRAAYALERWPTTTDRKDFNDVASNLMLGAMIHNALNVAEKEYLTEIQFGAYMSALCSRMRFELKPIPDANLQAVRAALEIAQDLMRYACDNERATFLRVLKENDKDWLRDHPELIEVRERYLLGRYYDTVKSWELHELPETFPKMPA